MIDLSYERRAWTLIYLCLGLVEGGTAAVMVRSLFGDQAPALAVDLVAGGTATISVPVTFSADPADY